MFGRVGSNRQVADGIRKIDIKRERWWGMRQARCEMGTRVLNQLSAVGKSQKDLAWELGISATNLSRYISGERTPDALLVAKMARALYTTTDYLLSNDGNKVFAEEYEQKRAWIARNAKNMTPEQKLLLAGAVFTQK